jgi:hypothetical protein
MAGTRQQLRTKLADEETFATVLITIILDLYGTDALQWSPDTLTMEILDDFAIELPSSNLDKIMCAIGLLTTNDFFKRLPVFVQYCNILAGDDFRPETIEPPDAVECGWGIVEGLLLSPPDEDEPFTEEIRYFIGKVLAAEGITDPPDVLGIALLDGPSTAGYSPDYSGMVLTDDTAFANQFQDQQQHRQDVIDTIREQTSELVRQLSLLPLQNGHVHGLMEKLQAGGWRG